MNLSKDSIHPRLSGSLLTRMTTALAGILLLASCANLPFTGYQQVPSENFNERVRFLVIHHTAINFERSMTALTKPPGVSSHYLIPQQNDETYGDGELKIFQLVNEADRAWHAGVSHWQGRKNINDQSIGIELVYTAPCPELQHKMDFYTGLNIDAGNDRICFYPDFDDKQIELLIELIHGILERNPDIGPTQVIGHSDITPGRRVDPGPRFPWQRLYQAGIGAWYEEDTVKQYWKTFLSQMPSTGLIQKAFSDYGYGLLETGILDADTINTVNVFQMHFRPWQVSSEPTAETVATLFALVEKYFPEKLEKLMARYELETQAKPEMKEAIAGQVQQQFPPQDPSTRKLVNNRAMFKGYKGRGELKINSDSVESANVFINGKLLTDKISNGKTVAIGKYLKDGENQLKITDILPENSSMQIDIPYPTLVKGSAKKAGFSEAKLKQLDKLINEEIKQGFPGAVLSIIKDGKLVKQTAYGYASRYDSDGEELTDKQKMSTDTLFDMASNTKMYATNYAMMKLVSEGRLDINKPINHYLAEYRGEGREARTVKDLMEHTAGYAPEVRFFTPENKLGRKFYSQQAAKTKYLITQRVPFIRGKGVKAVYSDTDYMLLGLIVERISGQPLDSYVEQNIYQPLGLKNSRFNPLNKGFDKRQIAATELQGNSRGGRVIFDNAREGVIRGEVHDEKAYYSFGGVAGHAGLFSNADDMSVLTSVMLNRGGYGEVRLFDESVIDQFIKPSALDITTGMGWRRAGNGERKWAFGPYASSQAYGHTGWTGTLTLIDPKYDLAIVLLTNRKHTRVVEDQDGVYFQGDKFELGKYGSIVSLVYEAFLEN